MTDQEIIKPSVQAFLVCDSVIIDSQTGKKSLIGTFTHIWAPRFPCQHNQMGIYFCLTDAEGVYEFEFRLACLGQDVIVGNATLATFSFKDRLERQ